MNEKKTFKIVDENGKEIEYEILYAFNLKETNKDYLVYTDKTIDENGCLNVFAAIYHPSEPTRKLEAITTDVEWNEVEKVIKTLENKDGF